MTPNQRVLAVLEAARDRVERGWARGFGNWPQGHACASTAISDEAADKDYGYQVAHLAHVAFLRGAGIPVPDDETAICSAAFRFNDTQTTVDPVLAGFDKAIAVVNSLYPGQAAAPSGPDDLGVAPRRPHPGLGSWRRSRGAADRGGGRDAILEHRRGSR